MRTRLRYFILLIVLHLFICNAQAAPPDPALVKSIDQALGDPVLAHGLKGMLVKSLKDGKMLYEKNSDVLFVPASNFKLLVSAAALDTLGPDYKMQTSLYITSKPTPDGVLKGNIILVGHGDPVLKFEHLQAMADKLKEMGIKSIEGTVIGDDSWFDDVRLGWGWAWDDEPYYFSAQISALNLNENSVDVWVRPGQKVGDLATVRWTPATGYLTVKNDCRTSKAGSEKSLLVDRVRGRNIVRVTGSVPLDYKPEKCEESIAVEDPTLFACQTLIEMLRRDGIEVAGQPARGKLPEGSELVMSNDSPPLSELLALLNKPSDNLIAECLFRTLGAQVKGKGSASAAEEVELAFLKKIGADASAVSILDGSGLSRMDAISPKNLVTILRYMYQHKDGKVFIDSLPIAGVDGNLKKRMSGTATQGNVKAKTGYLPRISSISGYVTTKAGDPLVFSIIMNNHLCKNKEATAVQDRIMELLANQGEYQTADK